MKTLYIDVYFMINFTVDILALFISSRMVHICINIRKLIISGTLGAILAIIDLFINKTILNILLSALFVFLIYIICCNGLSFSRCIKFIVSFYIASFIISGAVNFLYGIIDKYISKISAIPSVSTNRKALFFSLIILLIIGVLRLFIMMLSDTVNEKSVRLLIKLEDKSLEVDALLDTGNLVKDPMNMNPVIFLKKNCAEHLFPLSVINLSDIDSLNKNFRKRIRLVPVTRNSETHVMTGVRVDKVIALNEKRREEISATIVIDKSEGTFGGYYALAPFVAVFKND